MSRPRFLADHDLNEHIVDGVLRREPTLEFLRLREVGLSDRPDPEVLEYAALHGLIVVSHDVNTMIGHARDRLAAGQPLSGLLMVPLLPVIEQSVQRSPLAFFARSLYLSLVSSPARRDEESPSATAPATGPRSV